MELEAPAAVAPARKEKGPAPVVRGVVRTESGYQESIVLWEKSNRGSGKPYLAGLVTLGDRKIDVTGNYFPAGVSKHTGKPYDAFVTLQGDGLQGRGRAINTARDGQCYFDTLVFRLKGVERPIFARTTTAADDALHARLGFTADRVPRQKAGTAESPETSEPPQRASRLRL